MCQVAADSVQSSGLCATQLTALSAQIAAILPLRTFEDGRSLVMLSAMGFVKRIQLSQLQCVLFACAH